MTGHLTHPAYELLVAENSGSKGEHHPQNSPWGGLKITPPKPQVCDEAASTHFANSSKTSTYSSMKSTATST